MTAVAQRLEELRAAIRAENISWGELAKLQGLADEIPAGDVELLEWAGVPEDDAGITSEGRKLGHAYVMGNVNAYCPKCSEEHSEREGHRVTVLDCDYDASK